MGVGASLDTPRLSVPESTDPAQGTCPHAAPPCLLLPHPTPSGRYIKKLGPRPAEGVPHLQERLQGLWDVYQRLGLEDDIVDPSNTLLREGPVLKISFRRSDPMERYLVLVGAAG